MTLLKYLGSVLLTLQVGRQSKEKPEKSNKYLESTVLSTDKHTVFSIDVEARDIYMNSNTANIHSINEAPEKIRPIPEILNFAS